MSIAKDIADKMPASDDDDDNHEAMASAARDVLAAIKKDDAKALASALEDLISLCA